jgi:hypothetical protein
MGRLNNIFESILILEGRIEKARERYPNVDEGIFDFFVNNDPSGNQKYLDWMLGEVSDYNSLDSPEDIQSTVQFFHDNIQMFVGDPDGSHILGKDINAYKSLDQLKDAIEDVKEKIKEKEAKKEAKKEKETIYQDDRWLVVSPKSHKASCYYGAGTKWCVTSKDTDTHWKTYSKNATFFFILDKTKSPKDPLYKVAYRRIGYGNRYELWDATDREISKITTGKNYFSYLPEEIKTKTEEYHRESYPEAGARELEQLTGEEQALADYLGSTDFEQADYYHWDMRAYVTHDGDEYAVGTEDEVYDSARQYWEDYAINTEIDYVDPDGDYLVFNDERGFIEELVYSYKEGLSEEEIISMGPHEDEIEELNEKLENDDLNDEERDEIIDEITNLVEESEEEVLDGYRTDWEDCLSDPVYCLINVHGFYSNVSELMDSGYFYLDEDGLVDDLMANNSYGEALGQYDGEEYEGEDLDGDFYYIFRLN